MIKQLTFEKKCIKSMLKQLSVLKKSYKQNKPDEFEKLLIETEDNLLCQVIKKDIEIEDVRFNNKQKKNSKQDVKLALSLSKDCQSTTNLLENNRLNLYNNPKFKDMEEQKGYECEICFTENGLENIVILNKCGHFYCLDCMRMFLNTNIKDRKLKIQCPKDGCKTELVHNDIRMIGTSEIFELYEKYLLENTLGKDKDCKFCPKPGCGMAMYQMGDNPMLVCPKCELKFCFQCNTSDWHSGITCKNFQKWKTENGDSDALFEKWRNGKKSKVKKCPKCKVDIQKNGGCAHMHCSNCGHHFNWSNLSNSVARYPINQRIQKK